MFLPLQSFRFVFAVMIFCHHIGIFEAGGSCGVSFFLVLSGFVMAKGYGEKVRSSGFSYGRFMGKRLLRLYPLHLVCLCAAVVMQLAAEGCEAQWGWLLPNLCLVQSWIPLPSVYFSGNAVSWCLADLLFFYALFPWLVSGKRTGGSFTSSYLLNVVKTKALPVREAGALLLGLLAYSVLMCTLPEAYGNTFLYVFPLMRLPDFLLGICAFRLYEWLCGKELFHFRSVRKAATVCEFLAMALMVAACWAYYHVPENVSYAFLFWMPSVCFVVVFAFSSGCGGGVARILSSVFWVRLGNVSFTFYMVHQLCIRAGGTLWRACALPDCPALEYLSFFVLSWVSAFLLYHDVEKPLMCRWSQKWE